MKKALVVLLALALVGGVFADAPVANVEVAEFSGSATVTWGVDLDDDNATGFKNETSANFTVNIADGGSAATEGDGVWGEIEIKTDGLKITTDHNLTRDYITGGYTDDDDEDVDLELPVQIGVSVEKALLHLGPVYMGIMTGGTKVAGYAAPKAVDWNYVNYISRTILGIDEEDDYLSEAFATGEKGEERQPGIVLGYDSDLFSVAFDLRNGTEDGSDGQYDDDYAIRAALVLTPIEGLTAKAGFGYAFEEEVKGLGLSAEYALPIGDNMSLTPGLGYATTLEDEDKGELAAGLVFGFSGAKASVTTHIDLNGGADLGLLFTSFIEDDLWIPLLIGLDAGDLVENLSASAVVGLVDLGASDINGFTLKANLAYDLAVGEGTLTPSAGFEFASVKIDNEYVPEDWSTYSAYTVVAGLKFVTPVGDGTFTGNADVEYESVKLGSADAVDSMKVTLGAELAGFVDNTTFKAEWESGNLKADPDAEMGKINVSVKIAL
jgi:hypothetical protein